MVKMISRWGPAGKDRAKATEIPPRKPPHVRMEIAPGVNVRNARNREIGIEMAIKRETSTTRIMSNKAHSKEDLI